MPDGLIKIDIEDVVRLFEEAPKVMQLAGYEKALRAGGSVFMQEVDTRTPVQLRFSNGDLLVEGGDLKSALMMEITLDSNYRGGMVEIGFGKLGNRAAWVEWGHRMVGHKPAKKLLGTVAAHPFMRPAYDAGVERAITAFAESLENTVTNEFPQNRA